MAISSAPAPTNEAAETAQAPDGTAAAKLWEHAMKIAPKSPWRLVADEFNQNRQQSLDAFRTHTLPPGLSVDAVDRFLELPTPAS